MSPKGWKTDYFEIGINLRTVVDNLQRFAVKCCTLVASEPLGVHVGEQTYKGTANQTFKWDILQFCQRRVSVSE